MTDYHFTPDRVLAIRIALGLTQKDFAALIGVSPVTVSAWECGRYKPERGPILKALLDVEKGASC